MILFPISPEPRSYAELRGAIDRILETADLHELRLILQFLLPLQKQE